MYFNATMLYLIDLHVQWALTKYILCSITFSINKNHIFVNEVTKWNELPTVVNLIIGLEGTEMIRATTLEELRIQYANCANNLSRKYSITSDIRVRPPAYRWTGTGFKAKCVKYFTRKPNKGRWVLRMGFGCSTYWASLFITGWVTPRQLLLLLWACYTGKPPEPYLTDHLRFLQQDCCVWGSRNTLHSDFRGPVYTQSLSSSERVFNYAESSVPIATLGKHWVSDRCSTTAHSDLLSF